MKRAAVAAGLAALLGLMTLVPASAATAAPAPNDDFCTAFSDFYSAQFVIALISGFASIGEDDDVDEEEVQATFVLALSPKLLEITRDMRRSGPKVLRDDLADQVRVYQRAIQLLRDEGVSPKAIREIAALDINSNSGDYDIEDEIGISEKKLKAAGREFVDFGKPVLQWRPSRGAVAFLERAANECGIVPDTRVDCGDLLTDDEVAAILGGPPTLESDEGCRWEAVDVAGEDSALAVDVFASRTPYARFADRSETTQPVPGLGDEAITAPGFDASGSFKSCGRTVVARAGDRTVQVALCIGDSDDITAEQVSAVVEPVLDRL